MQNTSNARPGMDGSANRRRELPGRPQVGAIRWDAWTGGEITAQMEQTLGPRKYHFRLPWFAEVLDRDQVRIDGRPQAIMDREIDFAAGAGLDYWAFLLYPASNVMSRSLDNYLRSASRARINFCVILHNALGVADADWPRERNRAVALLREPGYQTVPGGRPLVYAFQVRSPQRIDDFRRAAQAAGLNPYCVYMGWNPAGDFARQSPLGFDAVSSYAYGSAYPTFAEHCRAVETQCWANARTANVPYVPLVTTGWDKQPRIDHPVSWEKEHSYHRQKVFPPTAAPAEIAAHLGRALEFTQSNPGICAANNVIIYAWNEHDEGGWLAPTWLPGGRPDTARLDAIRPMLLNSATRTQPAVTPP